MFRYWLKQAIPSNFQMKRSAPSYRLDSEEHLYRSMFGQAEVESSKDESQSFADAMRNWLYRPLGEFPFVEIGRIAWPYEDHASSDALIVLVAVGTRRDGTQELIGSVLGSADESRSATWLLGQLKSRGLHGVQLVTSGNTPDIQQAVTRLFPTARWQRCQSQFCREVLREVSNDDYRLIASWLRDIFAQDDLSDARKLCQQAIQLFDRYGLNSVSRKLREEIEPTLSYLNFPSRLHSRLRRRRLRHTLEEVERRAALLNLDHTLETRLLAACALLCAVLRGNGDEVSCSETVVQPHDVSPLHAEPATSACTSLNRPRTERRLEI